MRQKFIPVVLIGLMLCQTSSCAEKTPQKLLESATAADQIVFEPNLKSLENHNEVPDWFRDAKLGIYFHWGPYTVAEKVNEWYPRWMHFDVPEEFWAEGRRGYHIDLKNWHEDNFGDLSEFGYHDFIPQFTGEHFDANAWADLFEQAGAKFAGLVAEHHDGYAMWDSEITPWNAADTGPKKDITGELTTALKVRGLKTITTFHHARNLQRYKGKSLEEGKSVNPLSGNLVTHYDSHYPWIEGQPPTSDDPELRLLYGNIPEEEWIDTVWLGKLKEVVDLYEPDLVWFDVWLDKIPEDKRYEFAAYYLNAAQSWGKEVALIHKHEDMPASLSIPDYEQGRRDKLTQDVWLTDDTLSKGSWSYTTELEIKPAHWVLHDFIDIVSKNGQLLLNISPKADGTIPLNQRDVLTKMGSWLKTNGDAIYNTRPWKIYGEGPTQMMDGGHFAKHVDYTAEDVRFTTQGDTLFAIALGTPRNGFSISALGKDSKLRTEDITSVTTLNGAYVESWSQNADVLQIALTPDAPEQMAYAFKIE